ncbi:MAG: hypothetical protein WCY59_00085 [Anaerovoracaceae bacterium]
MKVDVKDLLISAGLENESFYKGKRLVKKYVQPGDHKSHCALFEWHDNIIHVELRAGLTGHPLDPKELREYPVSFQAPTYLDIAAGAGNEAHDAEDGDAEDEDEDGSARGKSGGGGKKPAVKKLEESTLSSLNAFAKTAEGEVSTLGEIKKFVIMGKEIAKEAYAQAFENLKVQLSQAKVMAMDLMKGVSDIIHRATPGGGLVAKGNETIKYKYDSEKTAAMFGGLTP